MTAYGFDPARPVPEARRGMQVYCRPLPVGMGFNYNGTPMTAGVVLKLAGTPSDQKLLMLRYVVPVDGEGTTKCPQCSATIVESMALQHRAQHSALDAPRRVLDREEVRRA